VCPTLLGEIESKSTPPTAYIEDVMTSLQEKLRGDVALLGQLGIVEGLIGVIEVGAGVLPVGIQKKIVEASVEIVVMANVARGAPSCISLMKRSKRLANPLVHSCRPWWGLPREIRGDKRKKIMDASTRDHHAGFHVELAQGKGGIEQEPPLGSVIHKSDSNRITCAVANGEMATRRCLDLQRASGNDPIKKTAEKRTHVIPHRSPFYSRGGCAGPALIPVNTRTQEVDRGSSSVRQLGRWV
jgi:hypothetical protein